ncbi:YidB family protein, partial [Desulfosarcina sp.]|uniref:YidB family protein n=1 Tax=Desulfosarcina sp. TaxID=2027861 RepID=UPI00299FAB47
AVAKSWLGDGNNESVSTDQITNMFGSDKISEFAGKLGLSEDEAAGGLSEALPQMVDKASSGGSLLDSMGGLSGALGMAGKLFGK